MRSYPQARRDEVVDDYHGTSVADPYRWLEDPGATETAAFVAAQNEISRAYFDAVPERNRFHARLTELWDYRRTSAPKHRHGRNFYLVNDGLQNQPVLVDSDKFADERVIVDPNLLSPDGTVAITSFVPSPSGDLVAYGLSTSGSDWQEIRVCDTVTALHEPDVIRWCKFSEVAWLPDDSGFYYARYPSPAELESGPLAGEPVSTHQRVYLHLLGTDQAEDRLVYARPEARDLGFWPEVSADGRFLLLTVWEGTDHRNRFYYRPLGDEGEFVRLIDRLEAHYEFLGVVGDAFYFLTDWEAPNDRIIAIDIQAPERENWREIVPEQAGALGFVKLIRDALFVVRLQSASHHLERYTLSGDYVGELALPAAGQILEMQGEQDDTSLSLLFTSFLMPPTVLIASLFSDGIAEAWSYASAPFDATPYVTRQVLATSKDGTRVPIFLVHRRDLPQDGRRPTLLYGYGGFNNNVLPAFSPARILWLEQGGIFASANLRGGHEYGETWHAAGMLGNKQNVFDDFIAAADYLIESGYTNSEHLAIDGRSNGGLLTAACMLQRPDLYGAVHSAVPVIDMLRYHRFTAGRYWTPEYGNAEENPEHFAFLHAYSPLHNVRPGVTYPPLLITTADTDDRVVPMHSLKFGATLQAAAEYEFDEARPILLRIETRAGHGMGKPTTKLIDETADVYAFLWANVGTA